METEFQLKRISISNLNEWQLRMSKTFDGSANNN